MARTNPGNRDAGSRSALGLCVIAMIALLGVAILPYPLGLPAPARAGYLLMMVAVLATFIGLYVDSVLSSEGDRIERYTLEVCLAAAGALLSIAIVRTVAADKAAFEELECVAKGPCFAAKILGDIGVRNLGEAKATWVLAVFSAILVAIAFVITALLKKHKLAMGETPLRMMSVGALLLGYALFLLTVMYSG